MRNTRWISWLGRKALGVVLAGGMGCCGWGCHQHNYYYYTNPPGCPPGTIMPSTVTTGPICDVPTEVVEGGTTVASSSPRSTVISNGRKSRVVVSEPSGSKPRFSWRSSDAETAPAVTQVEGALEDSSVKK
jgi:hypothetical protein